MAPKARCSCPTPVKCGKGKGQVEDFRRHSLRCQCGSVQLDYALLAVALMVAGAVLVPVHKAFALLLAAGVVVFFLPNLLALRARLSAAQSIRRQLKELTRADSRSAVVLHSGTSRLGVQAVYIDPAHDQVVCVAGDQDPTTRNLATLRRVNAEYVPATYGTSFPRGQVRIRARYVLRFEFDQGNPFELVATKPRKMREWLETLRPLVAERLDERALKGKF
jgi:hypothetical protein